jgi:SET domain-containing protein
MSDGRVSCAFRGCMRTTKKTNYCRYHLNHFWCVSVKKSDFLSSHGLPGYGLYAYGKDSNGVLLDTKPVFKPWDIICSYNGKVLGKDEKEASNSRYIIEYTETGLYLDGEDRTSCMARYINDPSWRLDPQYSMIPNAKFMSMGNVIIVVAICDIYHGEEIFAEYGEDYWRDFGIL